MHSCGFLGRVGFTPPIEIFLIYTIFLKNFGKSKQICKTCKSVLVLTLMTKVYLSN